MDKILNMNKISKSFSGVTVLEDVDFTLSKGEIRALLGANGAGKSTLMKILCGVLKKTSGTIMMNDREIDISNPQQAREQGIGIVHQELSIIPTLTVLDNFFLGRELKKGQMLDQSGMREIFIQNSQEFNFDINPDVKAGSLPVAKQQMIEIMKILSQDAQIIIMDEPTTSLTRDEKKNLFDIILRLRDKGKTIVYISHILEEIFLLSNSTTIMRNGHVVGTFPTAELSEKSISEYMSGSEYVEKKKAKSFRDTSGEPIMEVRNLTRGKSVQDVSFRVCPGEIVGFAGLVGAGRSEIVRAIYGADKKTKGTVMIGGKVVKIGSPKDAIKNGIGFIPEDRKREGLILKQEIFKNASLVQLKKLRSYHLLNEAREKQFTKEAVENLSIKISSIHDPVQKLSGGNQQKVVVSKWFSDEFQVLILDEPTKGIDIGAKEDIFKAAEEFAKLGKGVIFISSDIDEVLRIADKVLVIRDGKVIKEIENKDITQKDIMNVILQYSDQEETNEEDEEV